ncbi:MAG: DUF5611 family protein [Candidatus Thermoplasmatota archaeon]|nr:DUF5611 family protein [Candidatus Thermoplasmatota archaeon]
MQEYEVRRGHQENIEPEKLRAHMKEVFGNVEERDGKLVSSSGALKEIVAWQSRKNVLCIDMKMDTTVEDDVARDTIKAYNAFLERATGLTSKERGKRMQKKAKEGKL